MTNSAHRPREGAERHNESDQWQEAEFVQNWVTRDDGRMDERQPMVHDAIALVPFEEDAAIRVLDVGAGYGLVTAEVLRRFENAQVTLQDVSEPMFSHARQRLAQDASRLTFALSDFSAKGWTQGLQPPFDLVVSAIAIHNLYDDGLIATVYKDIHGMLADNGAFVNLDYAGQSGGVEAHIEWLREAGFPRVDSTPITDRIALLAGYKS